MPEAEGGLNPVLPGCIGQSDGVIFSPNSLGGNRLALNPGFLDAAQWHQALFLCLMGARTKATQPAPTSAGRRKVIGQGKRGGERGQRGRACNAFYISSETLCFSSLSSHHL